MSSELALPWREKNSFFLHFRRFRQATCRILVASDRDTGQKGERDEVVCRPHNVEERREYLHKNGTCMDFGTILSKNWLEGKMCKKGRHNRFVCAPAICQRLSATERRWSLERPCQHHSPLVASHSRFPISFPRFLFSMFPISVFHSRILILPPALAPLLAAINKWIPQLRTTQKRKKTDEEVHIRNCWIIIKGNSLSGQVWKGQ